MKKLHLLKSVLLLCALVAGSGSVWADSYTITFKTGSGDGTNIFTSTEWSNIIESGTEYVTGNPVSPTNAYYAGDSGLKIGTSKAAGTITMNLATAYQVKPTSIVVNAKLYNKAATISANEGTAQSVSSSFTNYTFSMDGNTKIGSIVLSSSKYLWVSSVTVNYTPAGAVAAPSFSLAAGTYKGTQSVTITTNEDGGTTYYTTNGDDPDDESTEYTSAISITETTTLKAITYKGGKTSSITSATYTITEPFAITDGVFDFNDAYTEDEDYGSGVTPTSTGSEYVTDESTWVAGNVTMVVAGKYRIWHSTTPDYTLRLYSNSSCAFSVPSGYVITKIVSNGGNFASASTGTLSTNTWTGATNSVTLSTTSTTTFSSFTVTYTTANQSITPAYAKSTYVTTQKLDFSAVDGLKAYVATDAKAGGVTMTRVEAAVPENTPLLLIGTADTEYQVPVVPSATAPAVNKLVAGDGTTVFDGSTYDYILYTDGKFYQIGSGTVAVGKAYLHLDAAPAAGARGIDIIFDDETTGISAALKDNGEMTKDKAFFNLNGQRVALPTKGLYIVNGRKVVVK